VVLQKNESWLTMRAMETHEAIQKAGSAMALAKLLGITRQAISQWGDTVPQARLWQLRALRPKWFK
jgi:transcriptional repressor of cell division inhibition gene dicB